MISSPVNVYTSELIAIAHKLSLQELTGTYLQAIDPKSKPVKGSPGASIEFLKLIQTYYKGL